MVARRKKGTCTLYKRVTHHEVHERGGVGLYVLALVGQLVMAWMLAGILLHLAKGGLPLGTKPS